MKRIIFSVCTILLVLGCKREVKIESQLSKKPVAEIRTMATGTDNGGTGYSCSTYIPLVPQSDGSYVCTYAGVPIRISNIEYRIYDDYGDPWPIRTGDPVLGTVGIADYSQGTNVVNYNSQSPKDDQFSITVFSMGGSKLNLSGYQSALSTYISNSNAAWQNGLVPEYLMHNQMPMLSSYMTSSSPSSHDVNGRIIRIQPTTISCDETTGTCVTTTFALAPPCFPRPTP